MMVSATVTVTVTVSVIVTVSLYVGLPVQEQSEPKSAIFRFVKKNSSELQAITSALATVRSRDDTYRGEGCGVRIMSSCRPHTIAVCVCVKHLFLCVCVHVYVYVYAHMCMWLGIHTSILNTSTELVNIT